MSRLKQGLLCICAAFCMVVSQAYGQLTTATLTGTVTDASGAAIAGATLKLDNITRGTSRAAVADAGGRFSFDFVPVGTYRLTVTQSGFETGTRSGIELVSGQVLDLPIQLSIQQQTQSIEVQANAAALDTTEAQQVATLNDAFVHELPVAHLDWSNLLADTAGTLKPAFQTSLNSTLPYGSGETVNGLPSAGYNFMVDGTNAGNNVNFPGYNPYQGVALINAVNNDAIQELSVAKGTPPAIVGNAMAASLSIITKSGTNQFHGSAHELNEVSDYDARNQFLTYKPNTVFNDWGGSVGGPILKNRLFFFASYEQATLDTSKPITGAVPTPYLISISPAVYQPLFSLFPSVAQPAGNPTATNAQYFGAGTNTQRDHNGVFRGDYYINQNNVIAVRYIVSHPYAFSPALIQANPRTYEDAGDDTSVAYTHTSAHWTEDTRVAYNLINMYRLDKLLADPNFGSINFGWSSAGSKEEWDWGSFTTFQEAVSYVHGRQSIQFGGIVERQIAYQIQYAPTTITYANLAQFQADTPSSVQIQLHGDPTLRTLPDGSPAFKNTRFQYGGYMQDDIKLTKNLTVNLGARYDYFTVPVELKDRAYNRYLDPNNPQLGPGFGPVINKYYNPDYSGIQPRIGLAYNLFGKSKTVLRAGFAKMAMGPTFYSTVKEVYMLGPTTPFAYSLNGVQTAASGLKYPFNANNYLSELQTLQSSGVVSTLIPVQDAEDLHYPNPYSLQWMFGIQQSLPWRMVLETNYNGNRGLNEAVSETVNLPNRVTGISPQPSEGKQGLLGPYGRSKYASLQVTLRKTLSQGVSFSSAFTYARDSAEGSADLLLQGAPQDIYNRSADWGPAMNDIKLRSVTSAIWQVPFAKWTNTTGHLSNLVLNGWALSGVLTAQTGLPANITSALSSNSPDRPNACGCGVPTYLSGYQTGLNQYLNPAAFVAVPISTLSGEQIADGNLSFDAVRTPGLVNLDAALSKTFNLTERFRFRLRADTFNTLNHTNLTMLVTTIGTSTFGRLTQATSRTMQLGAQLTF
jgi:carboxypeptidase family protein/TonB-dependent receptor-like protein